MITHIMLTSLLSGQTGFQKQLQQCSPVESAVLKDRAVTGAYRSISLLLLTGLLPWQIKRPNTGHGWSARYRTVAQSYSLICINSLILSNILVGSNVSTTQTENIICLKRKSALKLILRCDISIILDIKVNIYKHRHPSSSAANHSILSMWYHQMALFESELVQKLSISTKNNLNCLFPM